MTGSVFRAAAAGIAAALLAAAPARTEVYESISPSQMVALLGAERGTAELNEGETDTTVVGRVQGANYSIYVYDCDGGEFTAPAKPDSACLGFEYRAYFTGYPSDSETINEFNRSHHYGVLWRDEDGDLALQMNVLVEGGITEKAVRASFIWWQSAIAGLHDFMDAR